MSIPCPSSRHGLIQCGFSLSQWSLMFTKVQFIQRPNFWTQLGRKFSEFSTLLITVTATNGFPPPLQQKWFETGCYVNIVYGNRKSENSKDYAKKPQRNCTFMNSDSAFLCGFVYKLCWPGKRVFSHPKQDYLTVHLIYLHQLVYTLVLAFPHDWRNLH